MCRYRNKQIWFTSIQLNGIVFKCFLKMDLFLCKSPILKLNGKFNQKNKKQSNHRILCTRAKKKPLPKTLCLPLESDYSQTIQSEQSDKPRCVCTLRETWHRKDMCSWSSSWHPKCGVWWGGVGCTLSWPYRGLEPQTGPWGSSACCCPIWQRWSGRYPLSQSHSWNVNYVNFKSSS